MIKLKNFSVAFGSKPVLKNLNLQVPKGAQFAVLGSNGSGKTTLALALAGVMPDFVQARVSGKALCLKPGLIMQDPSPQFFAMTVKEELGSRGIALAKKFGLSNLLERSVFQLSEGEKQKINLVANLSFKPECLLLDEPLELLDPVEAARFREMLAKAKGKTLVWFDKIDPGLPKARKFFLNKQKKVWLPEKKTGIKPGLAMRVDFSVQRNSFYLDAKFGLRHGEKIALIGRNGCGKTTVLKAIAGIERFKGNVSLHKPVSLAPQNPSHLFFNETAEAELVELKNAAKLGIKGLLKQNPNSLSKGQQKMLSVATISPSTIALLDEPTTWLDSGNKATVYKFITESQQPMVIATHDKDLLHYCDRVFLIKGGEMQECSNTAVNRFFRA